jgi:hypothetical protein
MLKKQGRTRIFRILAAGLLLGLVGCSRAGIPPEEMTTEQWSEDLAYLAAKLPKKHGNAFHQVSRVDFEAAVEKLDRRIPESESHEILAEMGRIVALVGDGHTELWLPQANIGFRGLPVAFHYFGADLRIFGATRNHADLLGDRVVAIEDVPIEEVYERVIPLIGHDNEYEYLRSAPLYITYPEILHAVGITPTADEVTLTLVGDDGESRVTLRPMDNPEAEWAYARQEAGSETPLYMTQMDRWYWYEYLEDSRTIYLQYDRCRNQPDAPSIKRFAAELFEFVDSNPVDRFVVDLRHNTGGNFHRNEPLIEGIRKRPEINQDGKLFVITSRTTFSAATIAAIDLKRETHAILVGEPSRGKPNGYSDEKHLYLPNSNVTVNYSPLYREAMPELGDAAYLPVDLPVERTFDDYVAGRDPLLAAILAHPAGLAESGLPSRGLEAIAVNK